MSEEEGRGVCVSLDRRLLRGKGKGALMNEQLREIAAGTKTEKTLVDRTDTIGGFCEINLQPALTLHT